MSGGGSPENDQRVCSSFGRRLLLVLAFLLCPAGLDGAITCPSLPERSCICDTRKGSGQRGGWEISCTDAGYRIEYEIRNFVKLECSNQVEAPYAPAMYRKYNLTDVDYILIVMCPLPTNMTLSQVLEGVAVKKLKFEGDMPGISFDSATFEGLDSLLSLNLAKNQLESVPEDLFANLTLLKSVDLNDNSLQSLPDALFRDLPDLVSIQLASNQLEELPPTIFANLTKLEKLYLYANKLHELPDGIFLGLKSLKVLELANNRIRELHPELFLDTPQLMHLNIRFNNLTRLQNDLLQGTKHLQHLDLSDNRLTKLPENLLDGLKALTKISLNNCNLKGIGEAFFSYASNLTNITMDNNRLTSIPQNLFHKNQALQEIIVRYSDISELPATVFDKNYYLQKLVIKYNNLTTLPTGIFDHLSNLKILDLTGNALTILNKNLLLQNLKLEELYVSKNKLTELQGYLPFGESSALKTVDLSENQITSFSEGINWAIYTQLEKLSLKNNNLTVLNVLTLSVGTEIDLTNNQIRLVRIEHVIPLDKPSKNSDPPAKPMTVDLQGNPLNCDCNLLGFFDYATRKRFRRAVEFRDVEDLECNEPTALSGMKLTDVRPEEFVCSVIEGCPWGCQCTERPYDNAILVNCSNLEDLPDRLPVGTTEVHLEDNHIENLDALGTKLWENITGLYLDRNNVTVGDWRFPPNLTVLSLKGNRLEYLPQSLTDYVDGNSNIQVYLGDNPWLCDCETLHTRDWLNENSRKVVDGDDMHCSHPVFQNGSEVRTTVKRLREDVCPEEELDNSSNLITVSIICVVLAVLLFVVSVLYYRNKQTVIAYFYIHFHKVFVCFFNDEDLDEDKTFDAFVSYSTADRDLAMELLNHLENGDPSFKLCIHERDWLPGNLISWNIVNSVQNSKKTILVLSKHFLESVWFQVEFHTAYYQMLEDRIDRLIVVVRGDLPDKSSLDKDLQCLLSTKTFLQWGERWFWEKLRYALPHRKGTGKMSIPKAPLQDKSFPLRQRPNAGLLKTVEEKIATLSGDSIFSKRTESARNGDTTLSAPPESNHQVIVVPEVPVNSTKAQSRRFNGARTQNGVTPRDPIPA